MSVSKDSKKDERRGWAKKIGGIIFIALCFCVLCLFYSVIFRKQETISIEENRTLQQVPLFTPEDFVTGKFQDEMENSIGDQMLFSGQIKYGVKQFYNQLTDATSKLDFEMKTPELVPIEQIASSPEVEPEPVQNPPQEEKIIEIEQPDKNCYTYKEVVAGKLYKLDDSGYIVEKARAPEEYSFTVYDPTMLSQITFPKYLYFIETPQSADFNDLKKYNAFEYIKEQMPMTGYDMLHYNSFDEYKELFYQTDHHWNYKGSYRAYTQIMRMLEGDDVELLEPTGTHTYNTIYNGSYARDNLLKCATEKFTVYEFDIPPYKTYVNDKQTEYGYRSYYVSDEDFPHKTYSNHYGMYYGDDWAKVVYDFGCPEKENLLILGTSFTNAVNELIASHYNKTHILDFRHYKKQYGTNINAQKYMEKNNISKVVIIGHLTSLGYRK